MPSPLKADLIMSNSVHCQSRNQKIFEGEFQFKSWSLRCRTSFGSLIQRNWLLFESLATWEEECSTIDLKEKRSNHLSRILRAPEDFFVSAAVEGRVGTPSPSEAGSAGAGVERGSSWNLSIK